MTLAADLLLVSHLFGRRLASDEQLGVAGAGAVLVDGLRGGLVVLGRHEAQGRTRVWPGPSGIPWDAASARLLGLAVTGKDVRAHTIVRRLAPGVHEEAREALTRSGALARTDGRALGLFRTHHWQTVDVERASWLTNGMADYIRALGAMPGDPGILVRLLATTNALPALVPSHVTGLSQHRLRRLLNPLVEADPVAAAVRKVLADQVAAMAAFM